MQWLVLRCRQELRVRDALADLGFMAYVPCERVKVRKGRNKVVDERPVWRGYAFVLAGDDWPVCLAVDGVHDFIRVDLTPLALPIGALDPIMAAEWSGDLDYAAQQGYEPQRGDRVRVRSGKWKGYLARVLSVAKRKVLLEPETGLGRLNIEPHHLEAA